MVRILLLVVIAVAAYGAKLINETVAYDVKCGLLACIVFVVAACVQAMLLSGSRWRGE